MDSLRLQPRTVLLGLVGGIAAGKSFVAAEFARQGAAIFDADAHARRARESRDAIAEIRKEWPNVVDPNLELDRAKLAAVVFEDSERGRAQLKRLEAIVLPRVDAAFERWLQRLERDERPSSGVAVVDAPLLFEAGWDRRVDFVVFVDAPLETRRRRAQERGWPDGELERREARQIPTSVKRARADYILDSDSDDSQIPRKVADVLARVRRSCISPRES